MYIKVTKLQKYYYIDMTRENNTYDFHQMFLDIY